jgi:3',5'-cyclic AMP phosphodiesterase CpdA
MRFVRLLIALSFVALFANTTLLSARAAESYRFVAYGDTRSQADIHRAIIARIVAVHPEFVLQSGDLVSNGHNPAQWAEFDEITQPLRAAHIAYYPARGNHDLGDLYPAHVREKFDSGNKYYYAFTRHDSRFIAVDSMDPDGVGPGSPQYQWLESELAKAHRTAKHVFVYFHESPFSVGPHGPNPEAQKYLHPLFVKYKPTAVFCGHDHLYYRTLRDGVHYFVTGGGGAPLYSPDNANLAIKGDVYASVYHFIKVDVNGSRVTATTYDINGKMIDHVSWVG